MHRPFYTIYSKIIPKISNLSKELMSLKKENQDTLLKKTS